MSQTVDNQDLDHDLLRQMKDQFVKAYNDRDIDGMLSVLDPRISFTAMNGEAVYGHEGVRGYHERLTTGPDASVKGTAITAVEADDLTVIHDGHFGVSAGWADSSYQLKGGLNFATRIRWSCTMVKKDGAWKVVSMHTSSNIFDNPVLRMTRKAAAAKAVVATLAGLAAGFFLGRR
jgi:ketosteroid isomerase-like protein